MRVRDLGSTNGVFAGGVRFYDAVVPFDSRLRLGDTELGLSALAETVEREQTTRDRFGDLLGASPRMRELFADLERIAATDVTLLIEGETGTGKEIVAESVHRASARAAGPFVVFDCGAVTPTLVESELFGHERGAFTGATHAHAGVCEQADGGTLFLDELGELPKELQPKLLRAIEKRQVRRLGGTKTIAFDARDHRRDQPAASRRGGARPVPARPLLSPRRGARDRPGAARTDGRLAAARRALPVARAAAALGPRPVARAVGLAPRAPLAGQRARAAKRRAAIPDHARPRVARPGRDRPGCCCGRRAGRGGALAAARRAPRDERRLRARLPGARRSGPPAATCRARPRSPRCRARTCRSSSRSTGANDRLLARGEPGPSGAGVEAFDGQRLACPCPRRTGSSGGREAGPSSCRSGTARRCLPGSRTKCPGGPAR